MERFRKNLENLGEFHTNFSTIIIPKISIKVNSFIVMLHKSRRKVCAILQRKMGKYVLTNALECGIIIYRKRKIARANFHKQPMYHS